MELKFSQYIFGKKAQISSFIKIRPVRAEFFHVDVRTDKRTDVTKLTVAFRNCANAPKTFTRLSSG
jgi:hypothetical protein